MKKLLTAVAVFTALATAHADATPLTLNYSGAFAGNSTVGGLLIPDGTPFSFEAVFDSTTDALSDPGVGSFDAVVTFHIGASTYTSDPAGDVSVQLTDPTGNLQGLSAAGLGNSAGTLGFIGIFQTTTPAFDADAPVPTLFSSLAGPNFTLPFVIPLLGVPGGLVINDQVSLGDTAEITAAPAVPEPTSLLLLGSGALGVLARMRRRSQKSVTS
jgi:hypothetical protein